MICNKLSETVWGPFGDRLGTTRGPIGDIYGTTRGLCLGYHLGHVFLTLDFTVLSYLSVDRGLATKGKIEATRVNTEPTKVKVEPTIVRK